jgi:hypothetical protein
MLCSTSSTALPVHRGRRLVEQQQVRIRHQGRREGE